MKIRILGCLVLTYIIMITLPVRSLSLELPGGAWKSTQIGFPITTTSDIPSKIVVDSNYIAHVIYYDEGASELKHAKSNDTSYSSWTVQTIDNGIGFDHRANLDAILDTTNGTDIHVSYYDTTNTALKHAYFDGSNWATETVYDSGSSQIGATSSIALQSENKIHIVFSGLDNGGVLYAHYDGSVWSRETIYTDFASGMYMDDPVIKIDKNGNLVVVMSEINNGSIRWATKTSGNWEIFNIDDVGFTGEFASLVIDKDNIYHVTYRDHDNKSLRLATSSDQGQNWSLETLDSGDDVGIYTSLSYSEGTDLFLFVSYQDNTNQDLKTKTLVDGNWTTHRIETATSDDGRRSSSISSAFNLFVSSFDKTSKDIVVSYSIINETDAICGDSIDNDNDGQIDCDDSDCANASNCSNTENTGSENTDTNSNSDTGTTDTSSSDNSSEPTGSPASGGCSLSHSFRK